MATYHGSNKNGNNTYKVENTSASHAYTSIGTDLDTFVQAKQDNILVQYNNALYSVGRGSQAVIQKLDDGEILMALTTEEAAAFRAAVNNMTEQTQVCRNLLDIFRAGGVDNPDWSVMKAELQAFASNAGNISSGVLATANGGTGRTDGKVEDVLVNSGTLSAAENGLIFPISVNSTSVISNFDNKNFFIYRNSNSTDLPNEQYLTSNSIYGETRKLNNSTFQIFYSMSGYKPTVCVRGHSNDTMSDYHPMLIASIGRNVSDTSDIYRLVLAGNSTVGNVGGLYIFGQLNIGPITPVANDTYNIGSANFQFKNLYLGSGQVVTSDSRYKQDIDNIPDEILDAWEKVSFKKFKMKNAVSEKGSNNARNHFGVVAQDVKQIYDSDNIDVTQFGFFCHDSWDAIDNTDGEGNPVHIDAGDKYSLRYDELLCLEAACQRRYVKRLETKIGLLENELAELKGRFALLETKVQ